MAGPDNVGAELVVRARAGRAVQHKPTEIAAAVMHYYREWKTGRSDHDPEWQIIRQHTRRNLARLLANELDEVSSKGSDPAEDRPTRGGA